MLLGRYCNVSDDARGTRRVNEVVKRELYSIHPAYDISGSVRQALSQPL